MSLFLNYLTESLLGLNTSTDFLPKPNQQVLVP